MLMETHSHTAQHSACSLVSAADLIAGCIQEEMQALVLTDHHHVWTPEALDELRRTAAVPRRFVLLSGQEVSTADVGDVLVYGAPSSITRGTPLAGIRRRFPHAALVLAHPYRNGKKPPVDILLHPALDAVEIFNANQQASENYRGLQDWRRHNFTAMAGTDVHAAGFCATYPTVFERFVDSIEMLAGEIRAGRCRPALREISHAGTSNLRVTEVDFGGRDRGKKGPERIIVKAHADLPSLQAGSRTHRLMGVIAANGFRHGTYRIPEPLGRDEGNLALIEQAVDGESLYDALLQADNPVAAQASLELAARWLARLHNRKFRITPADEFLDLEPDRLTQYTSILYRVGHRHARRIQDIADSVIRYERAGYGQRPDLLVQAHGDYHPKNIFIGQDHPDDPASRFAAAIDFTSSYQLPPAFDVGTFLAQYRNQLHKHPHVPRMAPPHVFIDAYLRDTGQERESFLLEAELFQARTALSIIYYLVKVGLGESENLWRVLLHAERSLTRFAAGAGPAGVRFSR